MQQQRGRIQTQRICGSGSFGSGGVSRGVRGGAFEVSALLLGTFFSTAALEPSAFPGHG